MQLNDREREKERKQITFYFKLLYYIYLRNKFFIAARFLLISNCFLFIIISRS